MYARAYDIDPSDADIVSKQIDKYEDKLKHADRDEITGELLEDISIHDFVEKKYWDLLDGCKKYLGIKDNRKGHPCFLGNELVMTSKGYKEIKSITNGDYVLTHNNRFMEVKDTMISKSDDIYEISGVGIFKTKATGNHPYYIKEDKKASPTWKRVKDLTRGNLLGIAINQNSKLPISEYNLPFENKSLWWIIGRYLGDGWLEECERYKIRKSGKRYDYLEKRLIICCDKRTDKELNEILYHLDKLGFDYRIEKRRTVYRIYIKNKYLKMYIKQFGKYADGKKITNDILDLPINLLECFIDGYLGADGSYNSQTEEYSFKTVSRQLALGISACINKVYHKHCFYSYIKPHKDIIEGRIVNAKEKYVVRFSKKIKKGESCFYENGYIWCRFKESRKLHIEEDVYNLSVIDDNSYTVNNMIVHNCGTICSSLDVEEEIGVILCKSETTGKEVLTACIESGNIDYFGWLKQDYLFVDVVKTTDAIYKRLNMKPHTIKELLEVTNEDKATWEIYEKGLTLCVNQLEKEGSKKKAMQYKPKNEVELSALIAGIRPSFASLIKTLISREKFDYNIPILDNLIQTKEMPYTFILYQEQLMQILGFAGFPMKDTYDIIKSVSKKKTYCKECGVVGNSSMKTCPHCNSTNIAPLVDKYKEQFMDGLKEKIGDNSNYEEIASKIWHIVLDFALYGFNSSHSYCMALDSLNQAYLKAHYPLVFYEVMLKRYTEKGNKDKVKALKEEMKYFGIKLGDMKFGEDNRTFVLNEETNTISQSLVSIKGISQIVADEIYRLSLKEYGNFIELINEIKSNSKIKSDQLKSLIELGYFSDFGCISYLKKTVALYDKYYKSKQLNKGDLYESLYRKYSKKETAKLFKEIDNIGLINALLSLEENEITSIEKIIIDHRIQGESHITDETVDPRLCIAFEIDLKYSPKILFYNIYSGRIQTLKIKTKVFKKQPFEQYDLVYLNDTGQEYKRRYNNEKKEWENTEELEWWIYDYEVKK